MLFFLLISIMANSSHTKGPWILRPNGEVQEEAIIGKYDDYICQMPFSSLTEAEEMGERQLANAHLITASPDLLEACEQLIDSLNRWVEIADDEDLRDYDREAIVKGMNAIQKAKAA